jgi:hypothetical protein
MARFIVSGIRRVPEGHMGGATVFVGKSGVATYNAERAFVFRTLKDAQAELEYRNRMYFQVAWVIEELPAGKVANAILRARPVTA